MTHTTPDARLERIQVKCLALVRRARAREHALKNALAHTRAIEVQLRHQAASERRVHATEVSILRERLRALEQVVLTHVARQRMVLPASSQPLAAPSQPHVARQELTLSAPVVARSVESHPARSAEAVAPFDAAAVVASLLPLTENGAERTTTDVLLALDRMHRAARRDAPDPLQTLAASTPPLSTAAALWDDAAPAEQMAPRVATTYESEAPASATGAPWFPRALRRLVDEDAQAAGRLLLQLLPAQALVWPEDVAYSLDIAETGCISVAVAGDRTTVQPLLALDPSQRPSLRTDLAGLARTVIGRRGWSGRIGARLSGQRGQLRPLRALVRAPLGLGDLRRAGVNLDPVLLLRLLAAEIDPAWTADEAFTIAYLCRDRPRVRCYIHVTEGAVVAITSTPPLERVAATLSCEAHDLPGVLRGEVDFDGGRASASGDVGALAILVEWLQRVDATATAPGAAGARAAAPVSAQPAEASVAAAV